MNGNKVWWQSKTVWGSLVALAAGFATLAGVNLDANLQDELAQLLTGAAEVLGGVLSWYGRVQAAGAIRWSRRP